MTIDSKAREAAAQTIDPSGIFGLTWQECLERAEAAITAYLEALPPPKVEGEPVAWRVTSSNNSPQYFNEEGTAEQWGNSAGIFDSVIEPLYVTPSPVLAEPVRYEIIDHTGCIHYANDAEHAEKLRQTLVHASPVLAEGVAGWHKALNTAALIADACEMQQEIDHGSANTGGAAQAAAAIRALSPPAVTP